MTKVKDILLQIEKIELMEKKYDNGTLNADDFDTLIDLIVSYKLELYDKKVA